MKIAVGLSVGVLQPSIDSACLGHFSMQWRQCMQSGLRKTPSFASSGGKKPKGQAFAQRPHFTHVDAMWMPLLCGWMNL